jgi:hypothetical protein
MDDAMTVDLVVWETPRELDADAAATLVGGWQDRGADPAHAPFEPSENMGWFVRELLHDLPDLDLRSDAVPTRSSTPVWLATSSEAPARVAAIRLPATDPRDALETIFGLAAKYDLSVFDPTSRRIHRPLDELAAAASATFWPRGAVRAAVAGGVGALLAIAAWVLAIPLVSGLLVLVGGFLAVMAVYTFVHEARVALRSRRR